MLLFPDNMLKALGLDHDKAVSKANAKDYGLVAKTTFPINEKRQ